MSEIALLLSMVFRVLAFAVLLFALRALRTQGRLKRLLYEGRL